MPVEPKIGLSNFSRYYTDLGPYFEKPVIRAYSMLILSFFTIAFFGYFAIKPTLTTIGSLQKQITDSTFVDQKLQEKINALSQASIAYESIKPDIPIIMTALPSTGEFPPLVKGLEGISTKSGTLIKTLDFKEVGLSQKEATISSTKETPIIFDLTINGEYSNLTDFVSRLSHFERLTTIDKMGFAVNTDTEDKNKLNLTITGEAYYVQ